MIRFLINGLFRDKSRSRLPIIVVAIGVMLTVFMNAYITGFMGDTIEMNARFTHGHLKVMTRAYAENEGQLPNDLAMAEVPARQKSTAMGFFQAVYALGMTMFPIFTGNIATASSMANAYFALVGIAVAAGIVAVAGMRKMSS